MDANFASTTQEVRPAHQKRGSALIRYDHCRLYDRHRRPIGIPRLSRWVRKAAERLTVDLSGMSGASFCCGTGLNEAELLRHLELGGQRLGHLLCADASDGMLDAVKPKLAERTSAWETRHLDVVRDEFDMDAKLHFAVCAQAIQHLDRQGENFPHVRMFFRKVRQALVSGGSFYLIISTPQQVLDSHWFIAVMSGQRAFPAEEDPGRCFAAEHAELSTVAQLLEAAGFHLRKTRQLQGPHFRKESYFGDPGIVQGEEFRHASSFFWLAKQRGLIERYDEVLAEMIDAKEIESHRIRCEERRKLLGVSYLLEATAT